MDDWGAVVSILGVGGILYWKLYLIERNLKKDSKEAHARIEGNVKDSETELPPVSKPTSCHRAARSR